MMDNWKEESRAVKMGYSKGISMGIAMDGLMDKEMVYSTGYQLAALMVVQKAALLVERKAAQMDILMAA
jgi:hypothetical protein